MGIQERSQCYRQFDAGLVRATTYVGEVTPRTWPGSSDDADVEQWCAWLGQVWAQVPAAGAVALASPALADRIEAVCGGHRPRIGQVRRLALSLARYVVRMRGRATPFGVFAGVAPLRFGTQATVRWTDDHRGRTRADAVWLAGVIARLESLPALRQRLTVMLNDLVVVRAGRLIVPWQPHGSDPDRSPSAQVSLRHSPAVQTVMHAARSPVHFADLIGKLTAEIPEVSAAAIDRWLAELMARGVLISSLRPPATSGDGLSHILDQLQADEADTLAEVALLVQELRAIHTQLEAVDSAAGWADRPARQAISGRMRDLADTVGQPLMVDLRLGGAVILPPQVAAEAESAAGALLRLTPHPGGSPGFRDYHQRFLARYGARALIPVEHLVDPTAGLGFPAHYGRQQTGPAQLTQRDERLLILAQQAALGGALEIVLDDEAITALAGDALEQVSPVPHVELCLEVRAATVAALAGGEFTLEVIGVSRSAVALSGRFLNVLPTGDRQRMIRAYGHLPTGVDGALAAQLSFPPLFTRMENVARAPLVLPELICLAEHRDEATARIPVSDLAVTADDARLYVVSLSRRRVVEPTLTNAAARHTMPPIARLLSEIPHARSAIVSPFAWGAAGCLPFLPRVRYGRTVLAPARWQIPAGELPGPDAPWTTWAAAMTRVRDRLRLPASVSVGTGDRLLRLNLDDPMDAALLRAHLDGAAGDRTVSETSTPADHAWFAGRAHEIVIPVASTTPPARPPTVVTASGPLPLIGREHGILPGSQVLFAKVYGQPDAFDAVLTAHLPDLLHAWDEPPMWWFVRYLDPAPHLRLRLHLADGHDYGQAVVRVGQWASGLRQRGLTGDLVLDTYRPETARYGSGTAMAAAEAVFAADSAAVLAQLTALTAGRQVHPQALTAASMVDLASAMLGGRTAGMRWLIDHPPANSSAAADRIVVRQAIGLADDDGAALSALSGGPEIAAAWQARGRAAAIYARTIAADAGYYRNPASVVASLLHMHHVRAQGIDSDSENRCDRLVRAIALSWSARQGTRSGAGR